VNKVETMVEGYWNIEASSLVNDAEKKLLSLKLGNKINGEGMLLVKSQETRSQLANKDLVIKKMNDLVTKALIVPKKRKATKIPRAAKEKRLDTKKKSGKVKLLRKKVSL
jgi:ribosome-associated protein